MARYILLAIEDNAQVDSVQGVLDENFIRGEVVGVWFKPKLFCECPRGALQMSRGKTYGAWVHTCGKPIRGFWQHPRNLYRTDGLSSYEQGCYLGIVEPQDGKMPVLDHKSRGRALGITR
jgi:hypothetical protein